MAVPDSTVHPLPRDSIADRIAAAIQEEILTGRIGETLPSCRDLASRLGASPPSVVAALAKLAAAGLIVGGGPRRKYRVVSRVAPQEENVRRLLLMSPSALSSISGEGQHVVENLILTCARMGWEVRSHVVDFRNAKSPARKWDDLANNVAPTRIIAVIGTPVVARWAMRRSEPVLFLGGTSGGAPVTTLGVSFSASLRRLLATLSDADCLYFCIPVCGYPEVFATAIREACAEALGARGIQFVPGYHAPHRAGDGPAEVRAALRPVFAKHPPRVLAFNRPQDYFAALGLIQSCAQPPAVTLLSNSPVVDWLAPRPARFCYPLMRLDSILRAWIANPGNPRFAGKFNLIEPEFRPADSGLE